MSGTGYSLTPITETKYVVAKTTLSGDCTFKGGSKAYWIAECRRDAPDNWQVTVTGFTCSRLNSAETINAVKEAALAKIKESEEKR